MRRLVFIFLFLAAGSVAVFFIWRSNIIQVNIPKDKALGLAAFNEANRDIENQKPLLNPPDAVKAIYATSWSAANPKKLDYLINLIKSTELNSIVIDLKAYDGYVAYNIKNDDVEEYGAKKIIIPKVNALLKRLHDEGIYAIARVTVFQDPVLAKAREDLAIQSKFGGVWRDNKGLAWLDPASREVWDYTVAISKDILTRGFDEINFDYIRFPSDGDLAKMSFPFYNASTSKKAIIGDFFRHLRAELPGAKMSADLFGLSTIDSGDLGIGQMIETAYAYFDFAAPMVYPSHYAKGFMGYQNPSFFPYEVVKYSMETALSRLNKMKAKSSAATSTALYPIGYTLNSKLRPWLQDFDLGADYNAEMVRKEIQAVYDSGLSDGWMLWNPANVYTKEALMLE